MFREDFLAIAASIVHIFPDEVATRYYKKAESGNPASGKLFNSYHNQRSSLAKINEIVLRQKTKKQKGKICLLGVIKIFASLAYIMKLYKTMSFFLVSHEKLDEVLTSSESLLFLEASIAPWDKVVACWKLSYAERLAILDNPKTSTSSYLEKFPSLGEKDFIDLVIKIN